MGKSFKESKVGHTAESQNKKITFFSVFKRFLVLLCIGAVVFAGKFIVQYTKVAMGSLGQSTVKTVSKKLGEEMKRDEYGNVNILVVGVGGDNHQGGYLADTIIVASRRPESGGVSMLSIPRDLYVSGSGYAGRINGLFARGYSKGKSIQSGAEMLSAKLTQMLGLEIPYYLVADFKGFKDVVDTIGGIDIYVPESINDRTYPDSGIGYEPFYISVGEQHLDGETALKYARSRHTTSDFSRSQRQQEIIKAVIQKALTKENLTSVSKLTELYNTYTEMVTTNISSKEIIGMVRYVYDFKKILSFGLNTHCTYKSFKLTDVGCFLYNGNREAFNGAAVMIPNGATPGNVSYYDYIQNFASFIFHDQGYLLENPRIVVKNAIEKSYASQKGKSPTGRANKVAVKMKKYGFNLVNTENSEEPVTQTTVIVYGNNYENTINTLKKFFPIEVVKTGQLLTVQGTGEVLSGENTELQYQEDLGYDMEILIGNDFIDYISTTPFNYEK